MFDGDVGAIGDVLTGAEVGADGVKVGEADVNTGDGEGKIIEGLTGAGIGDAEKILTGALPVRVEDADDVATGRRLEG